MHSSSEQPPHPYIQVPTQVLVFGHQPAKFGKPPPLAMQASQVSLCTERTPRSNAKMMLEGFMF